MLDTARKLFALLSRRERAQLGLLFMAVLVMALLELVGIAAVLPFLALAADPAQLQQNAWLAWAYEAFEFASPNRFLIVLGAMAVAALVLSNAWMMATTWAQYRFAYGLMHQFGVRLLRHYGVQPYVFFLGCNSAVLGKNVLKEAEAVTNRVLMPCIRLGARAVVVLAITGLLVAFDPLLALLIVLVLGSAYGGLYLAVRRRVAQLGAECLATSTARYRAASECFGAIKDIKLLGKEEAFIGAFNDPSVRYARSQVRAHLIGEMPRYLLETVAFGGVLLIALYLLARGGSFQEMIPVLGLYAIAGYRLMTGLQQVYAALTSIRFGGAAVDNLHRELTSRPAAAPPPSDSARGNGHAPRALALAERLELDRIAFTYPGARRPALADVCLSIDAKTTVGIMGTTGAGKTTLVDVVLGLLRPQHGEIRIDGTPLTDANLRAWQDTIGYVPQHIYLSDDTVARNIAFGVPAERIDMAAVERAARLAHIHDFVACELPEGYDTVVGERGLRLSGGQRQRIGIARALYHNPALLVFDEATSALDHATETAVMDAVQRLAGTRTIILIAHRLTTLRNCDVVHALENGRVARSGAYEALVGDAAAYRAAAPITAAMGG